MATIGAVMLVACAAAPVSPASANKPAHPDSGGATLEALRSAIGDARCSADAQCRSVGVGARPCGGPEGYLSWSEQTADPKRIEQLAAQHAEARRARNARTGIASDCRFQPDPGAVCRPRAGDGLQVCQPGTAQRGNAV